jgi:two-component system sensor kinase FixL
MEIFGIINEQTREEAENPVARVLQEGSVVGLANHTVLIRKDGTEVAIDDRGAPIRDDSGNISGVVLIFRDITEQRKAQDALRQAKEAWERTFDAVPDLIAILDDRHRVMRANRAMAARLGRSPDECVGLPCYVAVHGTERPPAFYPHTRTLTDCREHTAGVQEDRLGGYFLVSTTPTCDEQGKLTGSVHVARDITERKQMEEDLRKSRDELKQRVRMRTAELEKANARLRQYNRRLEALNKELQDFAFVASHDLQEPLRKVRTFGDMLAAKCDVLLDEASKDYISRMQRAAARFQDLLNSLLSYSRVTTKVEPKDETDLGKSVKAALSNLEMMIKEKNGCVEIGDLPRVRADHVRIIQLFQNLIENGLKFNRNGQPPHVKVYSQEAGDKKESCEICVEDNGIGFEERYLDKIFLPFQRLHGRSSEYEGMGMGLAICKKIVERHGGKISARSEPGRGSTFIVTLPVNKKVR